MSFLSSSGFLAANLTAVSFACSAVCGTQAGKVFGSMKANGLRLGLAWILLAIWLGGEAGQLGFSKAGLVFFLSGVIGFGLGDVALYAALRGLGSRVTLLVLFCTAPLFAGCADWIAGGDRITGEEWMAIFVVLTGVAVALSAQRVAGEGQRVSWKGLGWALLAGLGQGVGASVSKLAEVAAGEDGLVFDAPAAAFLRISGGLVVAVPVLLLLGNQRSNLNKPVACTAWLWIVGAACFGPVVGVSLYQFALKTVSAPVTLALVALSPIWVIPLAYWLEVDRLRVSSVVGAVVAVSGVVWLALLGS